MTQSTPRIRIGWLLAFLLIARSELPAQDSSSTAKAVRAEPIICWRGKPKPSCSEFIINEVGFFYRMLRPSRTIIFPGGNGMLAYTQRREAATKFVSAELGLMSNVGQRTAVGGTLTYAGEGGGIGNGFDASYGVKARYRRWLDSHGFSWELAAGVESRPDKYTYPQRRGAGLTSDIAINANDHIALLLRYEQLRFEGRNRPALSFGIRPGAQAGFFTAASIAVTGLLTSLVINGGDW